MIKSEGLFGSFTNLDQIEAINLLNWIQPAPSLISLENYLANRILYPQTVPLSDIEVKTDLAILREVLKINTFDVKEQSYPLLGDNSFFNFTLRKILIPLKFLDYIPNLSMLVWVFVDVLLVAVQKKDWFEDLWTVVLNDDVDEVIGSLLLPQFTKDSGAMQIKIEDKEFFAKKGELTIIPCSRDRCEISYELNQGKLLGKSKNALEINGGRLGIIIDGRRKM